MAAIPFERAKRRSFMQHRERFVGVGILLRTDPEQMKIRTSDSFKRKLTTTTPFTEAHHASTVY